MVLTCPRMQKQVMLNYKKYLYIYIVLGGYLGLGWPILGSEKANVKKVYII